MLKTYRIKPSFVGLVFLLLLFVEIAGFILVGEAIGVLATLSLMLLSMFAGFFLLRIQGITLLQTMQQNLAQGRVPDWQMFQGTLMIFGAILLIVPGFFTDILGILLFIAPIRNLIWNLGSKRMNIKANYKITANSKSAKDDKIINLDPEDFQSSDPDNSPWKQK